MGKKKGGMYTRVWCSGSGSGGSHKKYKILSNEKLKICAKLVGFRKLGYFK